MLAFADGMSALRRYANMHMCAVISSASMLMDWEHEVTPESEEVQIIATIFPKVTSCL